MAQIYVMANVNNRKKWVIDADIAGCFDHIDHDFLLKQLGNFPARGLISQWLRAGYLEDGQMHPTVSGTPWLTDTNSFLEPEKHIQTELQIRKQERA